MSGPILLTGATGYLGSAVARVAIARGIPLRFLVRCQGALEPALRAQAETMTGDLLDPESLVRACEGVRAVIHAAGLASDWVPDPARFQAVNVAGTRSLLQAMAACGVGRAVLVSTVMALGPTRGLFAGTERTRPFPLHPELPYRLSKIAELREIRSQRRAGLDLRVVFPGVLYGPGPLTEGNFLVRLFEGLLIGRYPALPKARGQRWFLCHVEDAADGILSALEASRPGGEWIVGGPNVSLEALLERIAARLPVPALPRRLPARPLVLAAGWLAAWERLRGRRPSAPPGLIAALAEDWAFSASRAEVELGFRPRAFDPAFAEFADWHAALRNRSAGGEGSG
jgi:nucleoside-diphosphate-sugar epimerase